MKKLIVLLIILTIFVSCDTREDTQLEVGQVWKYEHANPFDKFFYVATITDIKDNYVKYEYFYDWDKPGTKRAGSSHATIFRMAKTKVSP